MGIFYVFRSCKGKGAEKGMINDTTTIIINVDHSSTQQQQPPCAIDTYVAIFNKFSTVLAISPVNERTVTATNKNKTEQSYNRRPGTGHKAG